MRNIFDYNTKYSLENVTNIFGNGIIQSLKNSRKNKVLVIGRKILIKSDKLNSEIWLDTSGIHDNYDTIRIKVIETSTQNSTNTLSIRITDKKYGESPRKEVPGGHFWAYDHQFYMYVPDFNLIIKDIIDYLEFVEVIK